jgi:Uma2 family endonuclease
MLYRFTTDDYHRMIEAGILGEDDRVELLDGQIIQKSRITSQHAACVTRLGALLHDRLPARATIISVQNPIEIAPYHEPEPDIVVARYRDDSYGESLPTPEDVLFIIEVADSSLAFDRGTKLPLYAASGIAEAWLVDIPGGAVERHTDPLDGRYRLIVRAERGKVLESTVLPNVALAVDDVLG